MKDVIPLIRPIFPGRNNVWGHFNKSLRAGQLSNFGPCYHEATDRLTAYGDGSWVITSSGASAIRLAVQTTFKRGSKILIPDFTHAGTMHAVIAAGMVPVFGGCDPETWALDDASIDKASKVCDGVVIVAPFGYKIDFRKYDKLCAENRLKVIYDLAGGFLMDTQSTSNTICYSLHATKSMPCGEGGLAVFGDNDQADKAMRLMNFATAPDRSIRSLNADNLKCSELTCAVLLAHLDEIERVEKRISARRSLIDYYQVKLDGICKPHTLHHDGAAPSLAVISGLDAAYLEAAGANYGVTVRRYYIPLSEMPSLSQIKRVGKSPNFFKSCAALPSDVTQTEADKVIEFVQTFSLKAGGN